MLLNDYIFYYNCKKFILLYYYFMYLIDFICILIVFRTMFAPEIETTA